MNFTKVFKNAGSGLLNFASKNSQTIMAIGAVGGLIGSMIFAYKARPKVDKIMEVQKEKMADLEEVYKDEKIQMTEEDYKKFRREIVKETVKKLAPVVAPMIACATATIALTIGSAVISTNKINKLAGLLTISETAYQELYDKAKEVVGDEKANEIRQKITQDKIDKEINSNENLLKEFNVDYLDQARGGDQPFYDAMTGRTFRSDVTTIRKVCSEMNEKLSSGAELYFTYNEFWQNMDLSDVVFCDEFGFGGCSRTSRLEPNMFNTCRIGEASFIILDWIHRPTTTFK